MSETETSNPQLYRGICKWFSNKKGYGFITIMSDNNKGQDVFVHQSNLKPTKSTYRTLSQGEYIQFNLDALDNGQAMNVCGIDNGPLMCDNLSEKFQAKKNRNNSQSQSNEN
jgi:CspA family cold shock protein